MAPLNSLTYSNTYKAWPKDLKTSEHQEVKALARYLCEAHSQMQIDDEKFTLLLEYLLSFYIERRMQERLSKKTDEFDRRLSRYFKEGLLFE